MKKTAISLLAVAAVSVSIANASPEGFYLGADVGYSNTRSVKNDKAPFDYTESKEYLGSDYTFKTRDLAYAIKAGYKFSPYFAVEGSINKFGKVSDKGVITRERIIDEFSKELGWSKEQVENYVSGLSKEELEQLHLEGGNQETKLKSYGGTVAVKGIVPITDNLDIYGKLGVAIVRNSIRYYSNGEKYDALYNDDNSVSVPFKDKRTSANLLLGIGAEYALNDNLTLTAEYQFIPNTRLKKVTGIDDNGEYNISRRVKPSYHTISLGLNYYFGIKPATIDDLGSATLNTDVLFAFNKSNLKSEAQSRLNELATSINGIQAEQRSVQVAGYADRLGSQVYNMKLSQKRADTVANYLGKQGVTDITATGYGQSNPVTANQCDDIKGRKALIQCLAPDRRVEVNVQGIKK